MAIDAGTIYSEIRIKLDKLTGDIKNVISEYDKLEKGVDDKNKKMEKDFDYTSLAGVAAFAAISVAIKASLDSFSQFEDKMASVKTVLNGTEEDLKRLEDAAVTAGSSTSFSATETANALLEMSRMGYTAAQSMEVLDSALILANGTGADLTVTSKALQTTLQQFSLGTDQAERLANVFAASKLPVEEISMALKQIGPTISGMGISIEETVAVLYKLKQAGMETGQASMALRLMLGDLGDESSAMSKKLKEYGVNLANINPSTHTLAEIFGELQKAGIGANEAMAIFGNRAGNAMVTLIKGGQKGLEDYTKAITGTSEAARQSAITDDTLADATKTMGNAFQVAGIQIAKEMMPTIRSIVDVVTRAVQAFISAPPEVKAFVASLMGLIPVALAVAGIMGGIISGTAAAIAAAAAPFIVAAAAVAGLIALGNAMDKASGPAKVMAERAEAEAKARRESAEAVRKYSQSLSDMGKQIADNTELTKDQISAIYDQAIAFLKSADLQSKFFGANKGINEQIIKLENDKAAAISKRTEKEEKAVKATQEQIEANKAGLKTTQDYIQKQQDVYANEEAQIELARRRAIAEVQASEASVAVKEKEIEAINKYYRMVANKTAYDKQKKNAEDTAKEIEDATKKMYESMASFAQNIWSPLGSLFSALFDQRIKEIDAQLQAELEAAGVAEDTKLEKAQKELDEAKASGDKELILEKEKALKRTQIEAEYEKKKAQLQYDAAMVQWRINLADAIARSALMIMNAALSVIPPFNIPAIIAATILGGVQVAAVGAAMPSAPSFATGGIVPGDSFNGDRVSARLNSGEMVLTRAQQARLFSMIGGEGGSRDVTINNQFGNVNSDMDMERASRKMAKQVAGARRST